jgi:radical SAM-linked protein
MSKLRLEITKGEAIRYISHLDYSRSMERALRRAKLPVAYSEGFNPHMKMAFASALSVGVTSDTEYMDIDLAADISADTFLSLLAPQLPEGIALKRVRPITPQHTALMAVVNMATYTVTLPVCDAGLAADCISRFNAAASVRYIKENPKGRREIDVKVYVPEAVGLTVTDKETQLSLTINITPTGSIKPSEVLSVLIQDFGLPVDGAAAVIHRTGLFVNGKNGRRSPLDIG